jgi:F-type H+-transporting ATPase subunit b
LEDRGTKIAGDLDASREMQVKAQAAATANDATVRARREEAQAIAREAQQKIAAESTARRTQVEGDFTAKLKASDERIAAAKTEALGNVGAIATDAASAILEKLTGARVDQSTLQSEYRSISSH